ncbi:MAG TPA: cellulase family glycosylhydrolase [Myxococcota bacterium]|nr:cellulase family glycosylhydrolase [Myxococcota bacterium]HOH76040.1 cellulase family glycosylhydrolase [Myxococcota bacterium]
MKKFRTGSKWRIGAVAVPVVAVLAGMLAAGCSSDEPAFDKSVSRIVTERTWFKDQEGRYVHFRGINVSGDAKLPVMLDVPLDNGRDFTFVGRPFPLDEADKWFGQIRALGFNSVRLLFLWESVFPDDRNTPDKDFLDYFEAIISKANDHGIYVLINMHENLWGRDMVAKFNDQAPGVRGDIENMLYSLLPPHNNQVVGDGAPTWATKACMPYKKFDSPNWGTTYLLGAMAKDNDGIPGSDFLYTVELVAGILGFDLPAGLVEEIGAKLPAQPFDRSETAGMLPLSGWWDNMIFSIDIQRCYAAMFAGDSVFPDVRIEPDGTVKNINDDEVSEDAMDMKEYFQGSLERAWVEVAKRAVKYPNIIGYDLMNEPAASLYVFAALALFFEVGNEAAVKEVLNLLLPNELLVNGSPLAIDLPFEPGDNCDDSCANTCGTVCNTDCNAQCGTDCDAMCGADDNCKAVCQEQKSNCTEQCNTQKTACNKLCSNQVGTCIDLCRDPARDQLGTKVFYLLKFLEVLPPDAEWETRVKWGYGDVDLFGALGVLDAFDYFLLQPYFERVGNAIQKVDENAIIWLEPTGSGGINGTFMTKPAGIKQAVYAPHYYPDIYPWLGFNMPERDFSVDEIQYRDYTNDLIASASSSKESLGNIPVVFGEFGTYWNYKYKGEDWEEKGILQSIRNNYSLSAHFLDNYYESYEKMFVSSFLWCYSIRNTYENGEGWNKEDFSIIGPDQKPRGELAWSRPYPRALSGKPVAMHFYSDYHYYDPEKGIPDPRREFELVFSSKETDAPTIIYVPNAQYPDGFHVWLSDGWMAWDQADQVMYYYPTNDLPEAEHKVIIRPPFEEWTTEGWKYFVKGGQVISR